MLTDGIASEGKWNVLISVKIHLDWEQVSQSPVSLKQLIPHLYVQCCEPLHKIQLYLCTTQTYN